MAISFTLNGTPTTVDCDPATPLLWALRDHLKKTGTKFGCGIGQCGACSVHIDQKLFRSCITPVQVAANKEVTTIEGLGSPDKLHPIQQAWVDENVVQCGYCQPGQIMAAAALLQKTPNPSDEEINAWMTNICRCGTYPRIRKAIHRAALSTQKKEEQA